MRVWRDFGCCLQGFESIFVHHKLLAFRSAETRQTTATSQTQLGESWDSPGGEYDTCAFAFKTRRRRFDSLDGDDDHVRLLLLMVKCWSRHVHVVEVKTIGERQASVSELK